jgi:hypothetical protein
MTKTIQFLLSVVILGSIPFAFADSDRDQKLEFAGTLEETLGHFWALELNLDEKNSKLALIHATHPIAELYGTMSGHLQDNPEFDSKLQETLMQLQNKANTEVSRTEAQDAIDDAKEIIQEARMIVVGNDLSEDSTFKMQLIMGLLETSKVEYEEAVVDGIIEEIAEFQDGSAFVWRSQQIYENIESELGPIDASRINDYYAEVWTLFDQRADPGDVKNSIDSVIAEIEGISGIDSKPSEHEEILLIDMPPLKQIQGGVELHNVTCKSGFELVFKPNGNPACVYLSSVEKLAQRGWSI